MKFDCFILIVYVALIGLTKAASPVVFGSPLERVNVSGNSMNTNCSDVWLERE